MTTIAEAGEHVHSDYPPGCFDDVRIYNRALSDEEITTIFEVEGPNAQ